MGMSEHLASEESTSKRKKKLPFFVVMVIAFSGFMLARGVVAAPENTIIVNGATALWGGEDLAATACDESITIRRAAVWDNSSNRFKISQIEISGINQTDPGSGFREGCGNQILNMAVYLGSGTAMQASWTIPSTATPTTFYFHSATTNLTAPASAYYANTTLTAFDAEQSGTPRYVLSVRRN